MKQMNVFALVGRGHMSKDPTNAPQAATKRSPRQHDTRDSPALRPVHTRATVHFWCWIFGSFDRDHWLYCALSSWIRAATASSELTLPELEAGFVEVGVTEE